MSLKATYAVWTSAVLIVVLGFLSWRHYRLQEADLRSDHRQRVELLTEVIKNGLVTSMLEGRGREFQKFLEAMVAEDVKEVRVFSEDGLIVASSVPAEIGKRIYKEDMDRYHNQAEPAVFSHLRDDGVEYYSMVVPIKNERPCQRCHGGDEDIRGILDVEVSMGPTRERLSHVAFRTAISYGITVLLLAVALFVMTDRIVNRPLAEIIQTMRAAEKGNLSIRHTTRRTDEIGYLAGSLNQMLDKLESAYEALESHHAEQLSRMERMATLGQLASAVAHEIKNPLAGISGAVEILAEEFERNDPRRRIIGEVLGEIARLDKSVRDLLAYARPAPPNMVSANIAAVLDRTLILLGPEAAGRGVTLETAVDPGIPDSTMDPDQIQQVFVNLVKNAFQSVPASGGRIEIRAGLSGGMITVSVSDNGAGIPEDVRSDIFQPFFTTKQAGTGLGLAICKGIVEKHGGTIQAEPAELGGSKFIVQLPIEQRGDHG